MSFFKSKQIQVAVRGHFLNFNVISKGEMENLKFYGKITTEKATNDPDLVQLASDEMTKLLASKVITKEGEEPLTFDDINELCTDEVQDLIVKVTGSSETIKKVLNK